MSPFKPMLSGKAPADLSKVNYPVLVSPKLDGIRCVMIGGVAMSRSLKPIPNAYVQDQLKDLPDGLDGELMIGGGFNAVTSGIMSKKGEPDFTFYVFDWYQPEQIDPAFYDICPFQERLSEAEWWIDNVGHPRVQLVQHTKLKGPEALLAQNSAWLAQGYEGSMIRDPYGVYKCGRGTTRAGDLMKLKHFEDEEATIIGMEEMMHNANEATTNELGRTQRSTHKENLQPMGTLGAFVCRFDDGAEFRVGGGPGLTQELRQKLWDTIRHDIQDPAYGKMSGTPVYRATIRFQPDPGGRQPGQAPRIPQFHGFRHEDDAS